MPFHLRDTMSDADLAAVARHHAPEFADGLIASLVEQAKASAGFCGVMVNTIRAARFKARIACAEQEHPVVTPELLLAAQAQMARGTRIEALAKQKLPAPRSALNGHGRAVRPGAVSAPAARF